MNMDNVVKNIIIPDTQFMTVTALKSLLGSQAEWFVEAVSSSHELYKVLEKETCQLLITDHLLFDYNHPEGLYEIKRMFPGVSIFILTNSLSKIEFSELTKSGIRNIIYKTADRDEILTAIESALKGKKYYSGEILNMLLEMGEPKLNTEELIHLTSSEIEIMKLIASGLTTKEIAAKKHISFHAVNTHRKNIFRKMGVSNASELIIYAIKAGWIDNIEYYI